MFDKLRKIMGLYPDTDYKALVNKGAQIIDVRTRSEYAAAHMSGSVNIPLDDLRRSIHTIKKDYPVITCCAGGLRSAAARNQLLQMGHPEVYNGGSWLNLSKKL